MPYASYLKIWIGYCKYFLSLFVGKYCCLGTWRNIDLGWKLTLISTYSSFLYSLTWSINLSTYIWQSFHRLNTMIGWSIFWTNLSVFKVHYSIYFIKSCCMKQRQVCWFGFFSLLALRAPLELCGPSFLRAGRRRDKPAASKHHPPARGIPSKAWLWGSAASGSRLRLWWVSWWAMKPPLVTPLRQTPAPPALRWSFVKVSFPRKGLFFNASQWTSATFCTEHINTSYLIIAAFYFPLSRKGSLLPLAWRLSGLIRASERAATQFVWPCAAS